MDYLDLFERLDAIGLYIDHPVDSDVYEWVIGSVHIVCSMDSGVWTIDGVESTESQIEQLTK